MSFPFRLYLSRFLWSTWSTCSTRRYLRVPSLERPVHEDAGAYTPNPKHEFHFRMSSTLLILTWSACFIRQSFRICLPCEGLCVCVYTAIHMQKTTTGHLMTMHVMFSEFMRQRLCTLCFPNSCAKDYLTAGGCRECHSSAANEDGYDILWYRSGTLDRRTCLIMSFHFRDGMWLTQEPPCRLMIWTWFHLFIKDDGLRNSTRRVQPHRHCSSLPKNQQCALVMCPIQTMTSSSLMGKNNLGIVCRIRPLRRQKLSE